MTTSRSHFTQPHFNLADAACMPLIESLLALQKAMLLKLGAPFARFLSEVQLPAIGCSVDFANQYYAMLADGKLKELAAFVRQQLASASC